QSGLLWNASVTREAELWIINFLFNDTAPTEIYTGMLLALVGMVLVRDTVVGLIGFAFIATGFVLKLRHEERMLTEHFGDDYRVYRQEMPALIPHPRLRRTTAFST